MASTRFAVSSSSSCRVGRGAAVAGAAGSASSVGMPSSAVSVSASSFPDPPAAASSFATSKKTTVMLSSPPPRLAFAISRRAASSRSSRPSSSVLAISSSPSIVVRPSEQSRKTSPASAGTLKASTSTSGSVPSARVITERCGWLSASSADSLPLRTSSATSEWSSVSCSRRPACSR
jgi:hypothetical protein